MNTQNTTNRTVAFVEFLAPIMELRSLRVSETEYILRKPLFVSNRDDLLQETDDADMKKMWFTTEGYKNAVLEKMLKAVNQAVCDLGLPEKLPVLSSDLTEVMIDPPFFCAQTGRFATICTSNFVYGAEADNKLSYINRNFRYQDESQFLHAFKLQFATSRNQVDTNAAYALARKFMESAGMDVTGLERDCRVSINSWNSGAQFVPLYQVEWVKGQETIIATAQVTTPDSGLQKLWITDSQYITGSSLTVTNR